MIGDVIVHPRVTERHPELSEADVAAAWRGAFCEIARTADEGDRLVCVGADEHGRLIEMVASRTGDGTWVIFHAMTPPSRKTLAELRITRR